MARVIDTRPQPRQRTSTIFDRGEAPKAELVNPNRRVGGVDLPPGPRLEKAIGDPNGGAFISWDQELAGRGVQVYVEGDANGTPALWKGESTGGGRVVSLSAGGSVPMSAPMRPHHPGIQGESPHDGSHAGEPHREQGYPQAPPPAMGGKMGGRSIPFANELAAAGIGPGGGGGGWINWNTQPHAAMNSEAMALRAGQDAVNQGIPIEAMMQDIDVALDDLSGLMTGKKPPTPGPMHAKGSETPSGPAFGRGAGETFVYGEDDEESKTAPEEVEKSLLDFLGPLEALIKSTLAVPAVDPLAKAGSHKYVKRTYRNGRWHYEYAPSHIEGQRSHVHPQHHNKIMHEASGSIGGMKRERHEDGMRAAAEIVHRATGRGLSHERIEKEMAKQGFDAEETDALLHDLQEHGIVDSTYKKRGPGKGLAFTWKPVKHTSDPKPGKPTTTYNPDGSKTTSTVVSTSRGTETQTSTGHSPATRAAERNEKREKVGKEQAQSRKTAKEDSKKKQLSLFGTEKSMDAEITMYDDAGRALPRRLSKAEIVEASDSRLLPDDYLYDYLVACIEEAWENQRREPAHADRFLTAHDRLDTLACAVTCELVRRMTYDRNLIRAAERVGKVTKDTVARILVEKGWMTPASDIYQHDDFASNEAMGAMLSEHLELSVKAPWIQTEPAPVTPKQVHDRGPGDVSHLVKSDDLDPFQQIMARRRDEVRSHWTVPELAAEATVADNCPVHGGRDMTKSMNLWNPMQPCVCKGDANAYG